MAQKAPQQPYHLLVVDEDFRAIGNVVQVAHGLGIPYDQITELESEKKVRAALREGKQFDIVVTSGTVAGTESTNFISFLRGQLPDARIITTSFNKSAEAELKAAGADAFIKKGNDPMHPFNGTLLENCLEIQFAFLGARDAAKKKPRPSQPEEPSP